MERTLVLPSGRVTFICSVALWRIVAGALTIKKWLVAPESSIAQLCMFSLVNVMVFSSDAAAPAKP